jgi:hypothetical protein
MMKSRGLITGLLILSMIFLSGCILLMIFLSGCTGNAPEDYNFTVVGKGVLYNPACDHEPAGIAVSHYIAEHPQMRVVSFSPASNNNLCGYYLIVEERGG